MPDPLGGVFEIHFPATSVLLQVHSKPTLDNVYPMQVLNPAAAAFETYFLDTCARCRYSTLLRLHSRPTSWTTCIRCRFSTRLRPHSRPWASWHNTGPA